MRRQRSRIAGIPASARSAEDWLTLAEVSLSYDGKQAAADAAQQARRLRLSPSQKARLDLLDALAAGAEHRFEDAALLFRRAAPRLDARRRAIALYGGYFARALADPDRVEAAPVISGRWALRSTRRSLDRWIPQGHSGSDRSRQACRGALSGRPVAAGLSRTAGASHRRSRAGEGGHRAVAGHRSGRPDRARGARQLQGRDRERSGGRSGRPDACVEDRTRRRRRSGTRSATC